MKLHLATKEDLYPVKARILKELQEKVSSYPSLIHKLIQKDKIAANMSPIMELIDSFPIKPWGKLLPIKNMGMMKEEAIEQVKKMVRDRIPQDFKIFMNGSDIPGKGKGAAAVIMPLGLAVTRHIMETTYEPLRYDHISKKVTRKIL
ncbi:hypothetical protein O181_009306 [Austropuccinia psidii MF-1]|uniref:Uncharacterized protein n=1 Tax=Austropuccinia psidii MF-1 TaxID=1389203 RepID=A0A9Q3BP38_9BASI|nr:hypothetical protein [Austropuccinia psidii MF-1]